MPQRCVQVAFARFIRFCYDESVAAGGAVPLLVAHNARFDNGILLNNCWQSGIEVPRQWRTLCSYTAVKRMQSQVGPPLLQGLGNLKLGTLAKAFGCAALRLGRLRRLARVT